MISSPDGTGVILVGGYFKHMIAREGFSNSLYEWNGDFSSKWTKLEQTLQFGRKNHIVIPLPDQFVKWAIFPYDSFELQCTMCYLCGISNLESNKLRPIVKFVFRYIF